MLYTHHIHSSSLYSTAQEERCNSLNSGHILKDGLSVYEWLWLTYVPAK